ncbi:MAG: hypothetical protein ACFB6S_06070 [Geminicoccaceae bacterium]
MIDRVIAAVAFAGFAVFIGVIVGFVQEIDLIVICGVVFVMAGFDFVRELWLNKYTN